MSFIFALLILTQALGLCALLINLVKAPDGYEDETGFHPGEKPIRNETYYDAFSERQPRRVRVYANSEHRLTA